MTERPVWFTPKRFGFGVRPSHPIGWLITVIFIAVFIVSVNLLVSGSSVPLAIVLLVVDIAAYSLIVLRTKS